MARNHCGFSIVAGLQIVAKFGHNQLCVYMALLIITTRALCICTTKWKCYTSSLDFCTT